MDKAEGSFRLTRVQSIGFLVFPYKRESSLFAVTLYTTTWYTRKRRMKSAWAVSRCVVYGDRTRGFNGSSVQARGFFPPPTLWTCDDGRNALETCLSLCRCILPFISARRWLSQATNYIAFADRSCSRAAECELLFRWSITDYQTIEARYCMCIDVR